MQKTLCYQSTLALLTSEVRAVAELAQALAERAQSKQGVNTPQLCCGRR